MPSITIPKTYFDLKILVIACLNLLRYPSETYVHSSMRIPGVSETMTESSDCGSVGVRENMYFAGTEKFDYCLEDLLQFQKDSRVVSFVLLFSFCTIHVHDIFSHSRN